MRRRRQLVGEGPEQDLAICTHARKLEYNVVAMHACV